MQLHDLPKITDRSKKRVGRGIGSGRGKTSGRGTKGQNARGKSPMAAVGGGLVLYKKLPFRRGLGNSKRSLKPVLIKIADLSIFKAKDIVDMESLIKSGIVMQRDVKKRGVKVIGTGELKTALEVRVAATSGAKALIEKAGGTVG